MFEIRSCPGQQLIQCTRQTYPVINDPYLMGRIACAHLLSPVYALGLATVDSVITSIQVSNEMTDREIDAVLPLILKGMQDSAQDAECTFLNNGSIAFNSWLSIGGCVSVIAKSTDYLR